MCSAGDKTGMSSQPMLATLATILCIFWFLWEFKKMMSRNYHLPPGPRGLPLVGYLPFLGKNLHQLFNELARIYGPICKLKIGNKQCVIISSPSLVKEVVGDHDITFANRNPTVAALAFSYGGNDIAFAPYGPEWRMLRKIFAREMLSNSNLDASYTLRRNEVKKCIRDMHGKVGTAINVGEIAFSTVINMITSMFWGGTIEGEEGTNLGAEFRAAAMQLTVILGKPNVSDFFPTLARFDIQGVEREMKKVSLWIGRIFERVIEQRKKLGSVKQEGSREFRGKDFMQFLLDFREQGTGKSISLAQIKAMLMDIVIGGTDTTSTIVEWAMTEMILHPEVMRKSQEELTTVVGISNTVEEFHIPKLEYLNAVVKETLRLHPAAPLLLPRCPTQSCNVGGYTIPKGTKVFLNVWTMHRDPEFWDNPYEFRPERFLGDGIKLDYQGNSHHYLPFGVGRRICAGLPLGERMLMHVLASLLHLFEWKSPNGIEQDSSENFGVVLEKSTPLCAIPTPRLSNLELYA